MKNLFVNELSVKTFISTVPSFWNNQSSKQFIKTTSDSKLWLKVDNSCIYITSKYFANKYLPCIRPFYMLVSPGSYLQPLAPKNQSLESVWS